MLHSAQRNPAFSHRRWTENQAFSQKNLHLLGARFHFSLSSDAEVAKSLWTMVLGLA